MKYEFALALHKERLVWIHFNEDPASTTDLKFFQSSELGKKHFWDKDSLYHHIPPEKKANGDNIYLAEPEILQQPIRSRYSKEVKKIFARAKSSQESFHTWLKSFNALKY